MESQEQNIKSGTVKKRAMVNKEVQLTTEVKYLVLADKYI